MSMNSYKVSCIIPCYNSKSYVKEAIDSVLSQTYANIIEIVVVDDGSTDKTPFILESYQPHINIIHHYANKNCGKSASLNLGIKKSTGNFIAFIDHDDVWFPEKIEKQINIFENFKKIAMVYTNGIWIDDKGKIGSLILPKFFREDNNPLSLLMDCYIKSASSVIVRREVFDKVGFFDENLIGCDDHDMWLRITEKFEIKYIKEPLYKYRYHKDQLSRDVRMWTGGFTILDNACKRNGYNFNVKRKRLAVLYYRLGQYEWGCGNYYKSLKNSFLAGTLDPLRAVIFVFKKINC